MLLQLVRAKNLNSVSEMPDGKEIFFGWSWPAKMTDLNVLGTKTGEINLRH